MGIGALLSLACGTVNVGSQAGGTSRSTSSGSSSSGTTSGTTTSSGSTSGSSSGTTGAICSPACAAPLVCAQSFCGSYCKCTQNADCPSGEVCTFTTDCGVRCEPPITSQCVNGTQNPACPAQLPAYGDACTATGLSCAYGPCDAGGECTWDAFCYNGAWSTVGPPAWCAGNDPLCPSSYAAAAAGQVVSVPASDRELFSNRSGIVCNYPEGYCEGPECVTDGGQLTGALSCQTWTADGGCSAHEPWVGSACGSNPKNCYYGLCGDIQQLSCESGYWGYFTTASCAAPPACP